MKLANWKTTVAALALVMAGCGVKAQTTVLTDSSGTVYPYAVIVTYEGLPSDAVVIGFTTQKEAATFAAEQAKDPKKTVQLISPKETK